MSTDAPWIALAIDFTDSAMFRVAPEPHSAVATTTPPEQRATHGEVLAWVCLLCWAKAFGRAGRVRVVKSDFASRYHLSIRAVEGMLSRAQKCAAVRIDGDYVTICNWGTYQGKATSAKYRQSSSNSETSATSTKHQAPPPSTKHITPTPSGQVPADAGGGGYPPEFEQFWKDWPPIRRKDKLKAFKAWKSAVKRIRARNSWGDKAAIEWLNRVALVYAKSPVGQGRYCKMPSSWLNAGSYDDDQETLKLAERIPPEDNLAELRRQRDERDRMRGMK